MTAAATRSRWLELRTAAEAARRGRDLLEEKREALVREIARRAVLREEAERGAASALAEARAALRGARTELGAAALEAAALAQAEEPALAVRTRSVFGVPLPILAGRLPPWRPGWGPGGAAASLDHAGAAFGSALAAVAELGGQELAIRALRRGLAKTAHRCNALEKIILPSLARQIHDVAASIEEEERDESFRRRRRSLGRGAGGTSQFDVSGS